jgi:inhibitor of KinA
VIRLLPQGEGGITVELGDAIDPAVNARVHALARAVAHRLRGRVLEVVPSYASLLVIFDPLAVRRAELERRLEALAREIAGAEVEPPRRVVRVPVGYGGAWGTDLDEVARLTGLSPEEVVARHAAPVYRVYLLGFTPGFPYLGGLDPRLACPRMDSPRLATPAGSVALAGLQTGIYPVESPGGWRILGRTPARLFDPAPGASRPFLLAAGDGLRFLPVEREAYGEIARAVAEGTWQPEVER